jgi:two-component system OmpR family response regulator
MRILSIGLTQKMINDLSRRSDYIIDECLDLEDSYNYMISRDYDMFLIQYDEHLDLDEYERYVAKMSKKLRIPFVILSKDKSKETEIRFLKCGADDFIKKPFDIDIILLRLKTRLKQPIDDTISIGAFTIDKFSQKVKYGNKELDIKGKPFSILSYLALNQNRVISKDTILNAIWEEPEYVSPNVVEVSINNIRDKLDKKVGKNFIETIRRRGYKFCYTHHDIA